MKIGKEKREANVLQNRQKRECILQYIFFAKGITLKYLIKKALEKLTLKYSSIV